MNHLLVALCPLLLQQADADLKPGMHTRSVKHEGVQRSYIFHVPKSYDPRRPTPVVLALHGATMNGPAMVWFVGFHEIADKNNFITIYPNGTGPGDLLLTWNAGGFPGGLFKKKADDVGYLAGVLDDIEKICNVDRKRVFACGLSNGGMMCYRLAHELSHRIAAIAPVAGTLSLEKVEPKRPISVLHIHGTKDFLVPYDGPRNDKGSFLFAGVEDSLKPFIKHNGCPEKGETSDVPTKEDKLKITRRRHGPGKDETEIVLYTIEGGGHVWPGRDTNPAFLGRVPIDFNANEVIWDFFQRHPMK